MLRRVYAPPEEFVRRVYEGTSVHSHWHNFQNFAHWYYRKLEPFGVVDFKWHLDKDLWFLEIVSTVRKLAVSSLTQ
jgi:hypothetical protein